MQHLFQQEFKQHSTPPEHHELTFEDNPNYHHLGISNKKRALQACDLCRKSKRKCDELRPSCGCCLEDQLQCNYQRVNTLDKNRIPKTILDQLEALRQEMRASIQNLETKIDHHQLEITAALGINVASRQQGLPVVQPAHYVGDERESPKPSVGSPQRADPNKEGRQIDYRCSEAPKTHLQLLGTNLSEAVQSSQQWEFERLTGSMTDCVNALVPTDPRRDISITVVVGHESGLRLIETLGLKVLQT